MMFILLISQSNVLSICIKRLYLCLSRITFSLQSLNASVYFICQEKKMGQAFNLTLKQLVVLIRALEEDKCTLLLFNITLRKAFLLRYIVLSIPMGCSDYRSIESIQSFDPMGKNVNGRSVKWETLISFYIIQAQKHLLRISECI